MGQGEEVGMGPTEGADFLAPDEIATLQQQAWSQQRTYVAQTSPFLQRLWNGAKPPERLTELAELPLCDKEALRANQRAAPPFGDYLAAAPERINRVHRTGGTTGTAMNLALSAEDARITEVVGGRAHAAAGLGPGHRVVHCLNYQLWMGGVTDHLTLERTGATVIPFGVGDSHRLIRTIRELGINAISCTPSYPAVLAKLIEEEIPDLRPADLGLEFGFFGGEAGVDDPAFGERLYQIWGMTARNANYGVTDVLSNMAAQCEHDSALHFVAADVLYPEIIDPDSGAVLPFEAGTTGELVITHLARECQPLVRFRTGDVIAIEATGPCSCGREVPRFRARGRTDDMVVVRGINVFPTQVAAEINAEPAFSGEYRIRLAGAGPHDRLPLEIELAAAAEDSTELADWIAARIKHTLGVTAEVRLLAYGTLPRTAGKTRRVIREE